MATRHSGPRRRPAPPHVQEKVRRAQSGVPRSPAPRRKSGPKRSGRA